MNWIGAGCSVTVTRRLSDSPATFLGLGNYVALGGVYMLMELSTPFLNLRWHLFKVVWATDISLSL